MLNALLFSMTVTAPILCMLVIGYVLRKREAIDANFIATGSWLVFNVALPSLLFLKTAENNVIQADNLYAVLAGALATVLSVIVFWFMAGWIAPLAEHKGVFVQGAFRSNLGVIGLATAYILYGETGLPLAAIYLAIVTILYNILAVLVLNLSQRGQSHHPFSALKSLYKNPLIIALVAGLSWSYMGFMLPQIATVTLGYLGAVAMPLALICIGGSIQLQRLGKPNRRVLTASLLKLVISPMITVSIGLLFGFSGMVIGILYAMSAAPSATTGFVMAKQMNGDAEMAAEIIAFTTFYSTFTIALGLTIMRILGWV